MKLIDLANYLNSNQFIDMMNILEPCCGSGSGKISDPDPLSTKIHLKFKLSRYIKLSKIQLRQNNFLYLILSVRRCLDLV